ncbi:uncharacterized protein DUF2851 [Gillisia mitskevichiae]|uniref:Uncharacterized protein DUF2851 n=1 Tax=Gillisia mitskevichiae TaxID=270921 RepID=A0A495PVS2_9FLAO|nr:DUF2851 family protein [Gillisia mitskevichiae]RKS53875.1 uncharacterized protein DUF2851 [Gillisia mitskevichiae]
MQEDFLHYLWKFKKFDFRKAKTSNNSDLSILDVGIHNHNSGPDFFNAKIKINDQLWAGNVEIHLRSSDWYLHRHEIDSNYDNVVLHVVWEDDVEVFRKDNSAIPTLELKDLVHPESLDRYKSLLLNGTKKWINCEKDFHLFDDFTLDNWLERVYFERLEKKSVKILEMLKSTENNWEEVLFKLLFRNFGLKVNADSFESIANNIDFKVIQKLGQSAFTMEALFLGQAGLLNENVENSYFASLKLEHQFLQQKFKLDTYSVLKPHYFRLRPDNFPTIRLSQLAQLYSKIPHLFSEVINCNSKEDIYELFNACTSEFWETHYTFKKDHKVRKKKLTNNFIDLLIINTIVPFKYCYQKETGDKDVTASLQIIEQILPEKNGIVDNFNTLRSKTATNSYRSQALIQLKNEYCDKNACLQCGLGVKLIQGMV